MLLRPRMHRVTLANKYRTHKPQQRPETDLPDTSQLADHVRPHHAHLRSAFAPVSSIYFPAEVWMMIVSYYPSGISSSNTGHALCRTSIATAWHGFPEYSGRSSALRSLSQTCNALRLLMLPLLWEEVDTCTCKPDVHVPFTGFLEHVLREHCLGLLRTQALAMHVKTFTVCLPPCSGIRFLQPFARCLESLHNLRCLRVLYCTTLDFDLERVFRRRRYPHVLQLVLTADAHPMLQAFPQISELTVNRSVFFGIIGSSANLGDKVHTDIVTHCRHLRLLATDLLDTVSERVHGVLSFTHIQRLAAALPELSTVHVSLYSMAFLPFPLADMGRHTTATIQQLQYLSELPNLAHVKINIVPTCLSMDPSPDLDAPGFKEQSQTCFDTVKKVLETRTHNKPKSLVVRTWPGMKSSTYPLIDLMIYNSET